MASVITYNQVIDLLIDITKRHEQVNTFFLGRNWETENSEDILFPLFQVYPDFGKLTANSFNEYKTQTIRFVCKMLDLTTNGEENKRDVHSDTLRYAQDIVNEFNQHPFYMRSNIKLIGDVDFNEVLQEYQDDVTAGWSFNLTFQLININQFCGMPIQDIPGYSATGPESTGTIVNVQYLTCATLPNCPTIELIEDTLVDLQEQIDNLPGGNQDLNSVLGYGNSTGNISITAGTNLSNILQVSDTVMGLSWNGTVGGNVTIDDTFATIYHDLLTQIESQGRVDILGPIINLNGNTNINGSLNQIYYDGLNNDWSQILSDVYSAGLFTGSGLTSQNNQVYALQGQGVGLFVTDDLNSIASRFDIWSSAQSVSDLSTNNYITVDDALGNKGIVYASDYSANFTDNSLVTKAWVLAQTPAAPTLAQVLTAGNSTGNQNITSLNTNNILEVSDTTISLNWNDTNNGSVILNNSFIKLTHDTFVTIDTIQTLILGELHHILTDVNTITRIDTVPDSVLLSVQRISDGNDNQVYVEQYLTGIAASDASGFVSKLEIQSIQQSLLAGDPSTNNTMIITDAISNKGLVYVTDYSANFTENSLVTKAWVLGQLSSTTVIVTNTVESINLGTALNINYSITALASAITFTTNGTANNFDKLIVRVKDNNTAQTLTFDPTYFEAKGQALPTTTVAGKVITIGFIFDSVTGKMGCVSVSQEI